MAKLEQSFVRIRPSEGWVTEHPTEGTLIEVVTRKDYDRLRAQLSRLLSECQRALEASDPPLGGYTRQLIGRIKRLYNQNTT